MTSQPGSCNLSAASSEYLPGPVSTKAMAAAELVLRREQRTLLGRAQAARGHHLLCPRWAGATGQAEHLLGAVACDGGADDDAQDEQAKIGIEHGGGYCSSRGSPLTGASGTVTPKAFPAAAPSVRGPPHASPPQRSAIERTM